MSYESLSEPRCIVGVRKADRTSGSWQAEVALQAVAAAGGVVVGEGGVGERKEVGGAAPAAPDSSLRSE